MFICAFFSLNPDPRAFEVKISFPYAWWNVRVCPCSSGWIGYWDWGMQETHKVVTSRLKTSFQEKSFAGSWRHQKWRRFVEFCWAGAFSHIRTYCNHSGCLSLFVLEIVPADGRAVFFRKDPILKNELGIHIAVPGQRGKFMKTVSSNRTWRLPATSSYEHNNSSMLICVWVCFC